MIDSRARERSYETRSPSSQPYLLAFGFAVYYRFPISDGLASHLLPL
jgi:hypothetical protein